MKCTDVSLGLILSGGWLISEIGCFEVSWINLKVCIMGLYMSVVHALNGSWAADFDKDSYG